MSSQLIGSSLVQKQTNSHCWCRPSLSQTQTQCLTFFFFFFCSYPQKQSRRISAWLCSRGKDAYFSFTIFLSRIRAGLRPAAVKYQVQAACGCLGRCRFKQAHTHTHTHTQQNCTTHLRRFACHTDLFKHSDVFHFAGLQFRMYYTDRHTANPQHCLSVSLSVSSLLVLIQFIIFSPPHTISVIPPKLPLF